MRIVQVVPQIANESSGPSHSVPSLCKALSLQKVRVDLYTLSPAPTTMHFVDTKVFKCLPGPIGSRLGLSPKMNAALHSVAKKADIMHTHSLWKMPNVYPKNAIRNTSCKLIISPRGTLSEWSLSHHKWRKKFFNFLGQRQTLLNAHCIHATCHAERKEIRNLGYTNPITVIPNGIDLPNCTMAKKNESDRKTLLFLSRIHLKKGIIELLEAWQKIQSEFLNWDLKIVGPTNNSFAEKMRKIVIKKNLSRVNFTGELVGKEKLKAYNSADLFILPSHNENFGIVIAEALSHGVPTLASTNTPWLQLEAMNCGWTFDLSVENIVVSLRKAMALPDDKLTRMGKSGQAWMAQQYSWDSIGEKMHQTYSWLYNKINKPEFVEVIE